jgi:hypothetical protein
MFHVEHVYKSLSFVSEIDPLNDVEVMYSNFEFEYLDFEIYFPRGTYLYKVRIGEWFSF